MEDIFNHLTFYYPHAFQQMRGFPVYCPVVSHMQSLVASGNGGGFGTHGFCSAYGEFIERSHFYVSIDIDCKEKLATHNHEELTQSLLRMINQIKKTQSDVTEHSFHLTKVKNIYDESEAFLPTALFTLAYFDSEDRKFIPFMDSCGAAAHIDFEKSRDSSLLEFIERQGLVAAWMTRRCKYKIDPTVLLKIPRYSRLAAQLLTNGEVHIFDLALELPGYVTMILYFSYSSEDYVQYAVGISAGFTPQEALTKALNELWLDYSFLYTSSAVRGKIEEMQNGNKYTLRHIDDNDAEKTRKRIAFDLSLPCTMTAENFLALPKITSAQAFLNLKTHSDQIFLYQQVYNQGQYHFTKIISPDFFLHMSVTDPLNIDNPYFHKVGYDPNHLYRQIIPFP